jgi:hypothetical protein
MRRLLLGLLALVFLGGVVGCSYPTEDIPEKAKTRPPLRKPGGAGQKPGGPVTPP